MNLTVRRLILAALVASLFGALLACASNDATDALGATTGSGEPVNLMRSNVLSGVVAYVDGSPITFDEVLAEAQAELNQIEIQRFRALQSTVDRIAARRLVDRAASAEGMGAQEWLDRELQRRVPPPPDDEVETMVERYKSHPAMASRTPEGMRQMVREQLTREDKRTAHIAIFEELRAAAEFESFLEPPRIDVDVPPGEPSWGPDDAPVTIVEFSDYRCKFCRSSHEAVQQILAEYGDRVRFVYREFASVEHPRALPAARAARCAGAQSRYWDYHDLLWTGRGDMSDDDLMGRAESLALDMNAFRECFESDRFATEIARAGDDGRKLGVSGTPTFFVNGVVLQGSQTFETLKAVIEDELRERRRLSGRFETVAQRPDGAAGSNRRRLAAR